MSSRVRQSWIALVTALLLFGLLIAWFLWPRAVDYELHVGGRVYELEAAVTPAAKIKGLGGRARLGENKGMLFIYDQSAPNRCIWMKDMRFAIDIVWLDANKKVVHLEHAIPPSSYPADFCAADASRYIIELNAGEAKRAGIAPGNTLRF